MANNSVMIHVPKSTLEAMKWIVTILDAKYEKADLQQQQTTALGQEKVMKLLTEPLGH